MEGQGQGSWVLGVGLGYQNRRRYILQDRSHERNHICTEQFLQNMRRFVIKMTASKISSKNALVT